MRLRVVSTLVVAATLAVAIGHGVRAADPAATGAPQYTAAGELRRPEGYRTWVFVGASLGLSYREGAPAEGMGDFHHVYLRPEAYDAYRRTGRFPDKTVLVLELFEAAQRAEPAP